MGINKSDFDFMIASAALNAVCCPPSMLLQPAQKLETFAQKACITETIIQMPSTRILQCGYKLQYMQHMKLFLSNGVEELSQKATFANCP